MKPVESLIRRSAVVITPKESLIQAAEMLAAESIGALAVIDSVTQKKPPAVLSERDIVRAVAMKMPLSTPVEAFMSPGLVTIEEDEDVRKAAKLMTMHNIRHLVVVNKQGELVGVVSIRDVLKELGGKMLNFFYRRKFLY
ncbi:CBS domain-containing protein [Pyrobaculum aerophilum]|uniref:Conserved protein with 2 CBS domains n=2 Tax=Pyrobaculum aerophilum TaxID=13773 RepID=Q8ZST7_PYRAE|nr:MULTISPECIES: CBS domain-containing protein [Pyrobaculum]AAL65026.1 conserved protein with 2 CBS domains [Pyrobaculum aerophilum str. IM2]MCX8137120.1 CBS domain-containing protein [Pyrobaculum aerophilum]HII47878.1 CBS domain-containing protein [Pyrobaculum aerophilum]